MPLRRAPGKPVVSGKAIDFAMVSDKGGTVRCMVTQGAIEVARIRSSVINPASVDPLSAFVKQQVEIETIASSKYDAGDLIHGMVVIAPRDLIDAGISSRATQTDQIRLRRA